MGAGDDPLVADDWPRVTSVDAFDKQFGHGDATFMENVPDGKYDFLVSSHCLEHLASPTAALTNWARIIRPGGFLIVTVPDEWLYEGARWPSRYNPDHKSSFTLRSAPLIATSHSVPWLLWKMRFSVELIQLVLDGWDPGRVGDDQTLTGAECSIEFVVRKQAIDSML
jgi:SAM-dependent methyltransferase